MNDYDSPVAQGASTNEYNENDNDMQQASSLERSNPRPATPRKLAVDQLRRAASLRDGKQGGSIARSNSTASGASPRVARMGLERSASDAARRIAMAKLTGEKIVAPPEYTSPKTPLPSGPLPSLAELQARHEQRLAMKSPPPVSGPDSATFLQRSASSASSGGQMLSRQPSSSGGSHDNRALSGYTSPMSCSQSMRDTEGRTEDEAAFDGNENGTEDDNEQRRTEERQEARSNLIRKLSRGRLAAGVSAASKDQEASGSSSATPASGTSLQRRPSLAEVLAKAEARKAALAQKTDQAADSSFPTSSRAMDNSQTAYMSTAANVATPDKSLYAHIPVPPTPEDGRSPSRQGLSRKPSLQAHETLSPPASTSSQPYRHTMQQDRDTHFAGSQAEDNFDLEYEHSNALSQSGRGMSPDFAHQGDSPMTASTVHSSPPPPVPDKHNQVPSSTFQSPPDSPLDARMIPGSSQATHPQNLSTAAAAITASNTRAAASEHGGDNREHSRRINDALPETPDSLSPASNTSPIAEILRHQDTRPHQEGIPRYLTEHYGTTTADSLLADRALYPAPFSFLRQHGHQGNPSTDSFPISVAGSQASRYTHNAALIADKYDAPEELADVDSSTDHFLYNQSTLPLRSERAVQPIPSSAYRFPSPHLTSQFTHSRNNSLKPGERLDSRMDTMIHQLESMQAVESDKGNNNGRSGRPVNPLHMFDSQAHLDNLSAPSAALMQPQTSASALHQFHATHEPVLPVPHELAPSFTAATADGAYRSRADTAGQPDSQVVGARVHDSATAVAEFRELQDDYQPIGSGSDHWEQRRSSASSIDSQHDLTLLPDREPPKNEAKEKVMQRLNNLLAGYTTPKSPIKLDVAPRQLLLHTPVLQVVNANTVKDRYLYLFNDLLVIAKPLVEDDVNGEPIIPHLDTKFLVKSIVELPKLKLTAQAAESTEDSVNKRKHPLLLTFVDRFANDPRKAIAALIAKAGLSNDAATVANLLFRNPELNRSQLGAYLSSREQKYVMKAYCERFRLAGIRIEDALRVFLGSLRLPNDYAAAEYLLSVFASQWLLSNPGTGMSNDSVYATKLVISMMELNDALHSGIDDETAAAGNLFSFPNHAITVGDFIAAFRLKDPHGAMPDENLTRIYLAIRKNRLQQAADNSIASVSPELETTFHPAKLPSRLTYRVPSENISITIPKPDPKFSIRLVGQDMRFEPTVLTFARSRTATFRITPTALGSRAVLFVKLGSNAHFYRNLPINKTFSVERAFMSHTFQIAFVNHLNVKRKYLFSLAAAEAKFNWIDTLRQCIENSPVQQASTPRAAKVTEAVSLQVLRDALIAPEEVAPVLVNKPLLNNVQNGRLQSPPNSRGGMRTAGGLQRSNSFSKTYSHGAGKAEIDLGERRPSVHSTLPGASNLHAATAASMVRRGSRDDAQTAHAKAGTEIVHIVQQNSLMPLVLGFVSAGLGVDAMPRKPVLPETVTSQKTPPQARGTGRFRGL